MAQAEAVDRISALSASFPKPPGFTPSYGTAGFRAEASQLISTVFRCGALIAARSIVTGKACGIMITASHNADMDNGVKLVEPSGDMLNQQWEPIATDLARASSASQLRDTLSVALQQQQDTSTTTSSKPLVLMACDTRPSAAELSAAASTGAAGLGAEVIDLGQLTTPQLHWMVVAYNSGKPLTTESYYSTLLDNFQLLIGGTTPLSDALIVDCANGVGGQHIDAIKPRLEQLGISMVLKNTGDGRLNHQCGADYVEKARQLPTSFGIQEVAGSRCCSMDGDADRLVYFIPPPTPSDALLVVDGDMIACLAATLLKQIMAGLPQDVASSIKVGMVQTAYANGASTSYMRDVLGAEVVMTATGVKHLHHAALQYDLAVYFEANGHGTVLFNPQLIARLEKMPGGPAAQELLALSRMVNQSTGDALSNILLVEAILRRQGWTIQQAASIYKQLPSLQVKVQVANRAIITTTNAETTCVTPEGLQAAVDAAVSKYPHGRSFVRPSGTEDVVRVYAEAATEEAVQQLAQEVARLTYDMAGGVGSRP